MATMMTPEAFPGNHAVDFRAPPPSPVGPGGRPSFTNDEILTEYLEQSLRVPDLVLPDRAFPRQKSIRNPPVLDLNKLGEIESETGREIVESIAQQFGCLEVINHDISQDLVKLLLDLGSGIFEISPEKKRSMARSTERQCGFEENNHGEEENITSMSDENEVFVWCEDEAIRSEMEGIWPSEYSNFSEKMEKLSTKMEEIGGKILRFLKHNSWRNFVTTTSEQESAAGKLWHIQKHRRSDKSENSLRYDVIRMLIRGSEFPHALCIHICSGATEFHVYSKKGWVSFCPAQHSIVVTVGDKLQEWTAGKYKHVIGRPVFRSADEKHNISMGFFYLPSQIANSNKSMTVSVTQQIIFYILFTLIFQFFYSYLQYVI